MENLKLSVETLSVEIRVLTINQKKMTLSVFNQIREEPLFDNNFHQLGEVLGYVNKKDYWIIWSNGKELRKAKLQRISIETPRYVFQMIQLFKEINYHVNPKFDFYDYKKGRHDDWEKLIDGEVEGRLSISNSFAQKYNEFYDELIGGENQLFISI